jgi:hypothetical protein
MKGADVFTILSDAVSTAIGSAQSFDGALPNKLPSLSG